MIKRNIKPGRSIISVLLVLLYAVIFNTGAMAQGVGAKIDSLPPKQLSPAETKLKLTGMLPKVDSAYKSLINKYLGTPESEMPKFEYESEHLASLAVAGYEEARLVNDVSGSGELKQSVMTLMDTLSNFTFVIHVSLGDDDKENLQKYQLRKKDIEASMIEIAHQRQLVEIAKAAYVKKNKLAL